MRRTLLSILAVTLPLSAAHARAEPSHLDARAVLLRDEVRVGDPIVLGLSLEWTGDEPLRVRDPAELRSWTIEVIGPSPEDGRARECRPPVSNCGWPPPDVAVELRPGEPRGLYVALAESRLVWRPGRHQVRATWTPAPPVGRLRALDFPSATGLPPAPDGPAFALALRLWHDGAQLFAHRVGDEEWSSRAWTERHCPERRRIQGAPRLRPLSTSWLIFDVGPATPEEMEALQERLGPDPVQFCWRGRWTVPGSSPWPWQARHAELDFVRYTRAVDYPDFPTEPPAQDELGEWRDLRTLSQLRRDLAAGELDAARRELEAAARDHPVWGPALRVEERRLHWLEEHAATLMLD